MWYIKTILFGFDYAMMILRKECFKYEADCFGNLCDSCNQTIEDTYYIPVLNWGMCKKCFDEWKETAIFYKEDTDFEELNIHWIEKWCDRLNISMTNTTFH